MTAPIDTNAWREMADEAEARAKIPDGDPYSIPHPHGWMTGIRTPVEEDGGVDMGRLGEIADAIAAARSDVPALARELRRAADEVERLREEWAIEKASAILLRDERERILACAAANGIERDTAIGDRDRLLALLKEAPRTRTGT